MSAWGKKSSDAVRAPPPPDRQNSSGGGNNRRGSNNNSNNNNRSNNNSGGGRGRGRGRGGGGRGRNNGRNNNRDNNKNNSRHERIVVDVDLLGPGDGESLQQKAVKRYTLDVLLACRLDYTDKPEPDSVVAFNPPNHCAWVDEARVEEITTSLGPRKGGEVSRQAPRNKPIHDTAPALEDCKPLEVNDETRWKSKVFHKDGAGGGDEEATAIADMSDDEVLKKALLILNKLSLTKFEKLSDEFVATGIGKSPGCLKGTVEMIVYKAQNEPHFSNMYAMLCFKLAKISFDDAGGKKAFKKLLLSRCQSEFEEDMQHKMDRAIQGVDDPEEQAYHQNLVKKNYLGHMRFIGELYKGDLIKLDVMLFCLTTLLEGYEEEKVECFTKLIATIGYPLEQQSALMQQAGKPNPQVNLDTCWSKVEEMIAGNTNVSNRIKFMLLDLKEMRSNGWVERRKKETAKTLDQIHKEVAREEAQAARRSSKASHSGGGLRRSNSQPVVDSDGFIQPMKGSRSSGNLSRSISESGGGGPGPSPNRPKPTVRRAQSFSVMQQRPNKSPPGPRGPPAPPLTKATPKLSLKEVETKTQNLLKEYFVGGDTADAIQTLQELVVDEERAAKAVEASILLVLERKESEVDKMLAVLVATYKATAAADNKSGITKKAVATGMNDPLEFLSDIEIDAPLAGNLLAKIVAAYISEGALELELLLQAPVYFLGDGKPAIFGAKVLKALGTEVLPAQVAVIEKLMTNKDKEDFDSAQALVDSIVGKA